jgi:putative colanic acid biosynthesis UDP-glucose lipid carrier transferase
VTNPVVLKRSARFGLLSLTQALLPPLIAGGMLALAARALDVPGEHFGWLLSLVIVLAAVLLQPSQALSPQLVPSKLQLVSRIAGRWLVLLFALLALGYVTKSSDEFSRRVILIWAAVTPFVLMISSLVLHHVLREMLHNPAYVRRAVFVGYNEISLSMADRLNDNPTAALAVDGFFDDRAPGRLGPLAQSKLRGGFKDIAQYVKDNAIDVVFVALPVPVTQITRVKLLLDDLRDTTVSVYYIPTVLPFDCIQGGISEFLGMPLIALCETPFHGYRGVGKRLLDIALATAILAFAAPFMLLVAAGIKLTSAGPVIFKQRRYGLDGQEIIVYKFRSMRVTEDGEHIKQASRTDSRITPLGRVLRRTSIDELPQLINVLQGRMSLVGPRPHAVAHNEIYRKLIKGYMIRHKVAPGMTGLAQVHGMRGETQTIEQMEARVKYDLDYLRNWSPLLDLKILARTLLIVARGDKAY